MLAWGPAKGYTGGRHSMAEAMSRLAAKGYEWVALITDDATVIDSGPHAGKTIGAYNLEVWPEFVRECEARGMLPGYWCTEGGNVWKVPTGSKFGIAEVEGPGDLEGVTLVIRGQGAGPLPTGLALAICTNFSTLNRENCRPLIAAGFHCLTEAYLNQNPNLDPEGLDQIARNLGWATSQPVAGVYPWEGQPPPSYEEWADWPMADYLGEYVI